MSLSVPRLRMIAGPNGSGKSTIKNVLPAKLVGVYLNADEIQEELVETSALDLAKFKLNIPDISLSDWISESPLAQYVQYEPEKVNGTIRFEVLTVERLGELPYISAILSEVIRELLIQKRSNFTFETVMSHPNKIEILTRALSRL